MEFWHGIPALPLWNILFPWFPVTPVSKFAALFVHPSKFPLRHQYQLAVSCCTASSPQIERLHPTLMISHSFLRVGSWEAVQPDGRAYLGCASSGLLVRSQPSFIHSFLHPFICVYFLPSSSELPHTAIGRRFRFSTTWTSAQCCSRRDRWLPPEQVIPEEWACVAKIKATVSFLIWYLQWCVLTSALVTQTGTRRRSQSWGACLPRGSRLSTTAFSFADPSTSMFPKVLFSSHSLCTPLILACSPGLPITV